MKPTWTRARITAWIVGSDGEWDLGSLGKDMSSISISVASFSLCRLSQCLAEPVEVRGGKDTGFGALWLCWKILLTSSGGRQTGRREDMWVRKANSRSLLREVISEARKGREGHGDWEERMLERKDLRDVACWDILRLPIDFFFTVLIPAIYFGLLYFFCGTLHKCTMRQGSHLGYIGRRLEAFASSFSAFLTTCRKSSGKKTIQG